MQEDQKVIEIYTDGSCLSNPGGPSGYGIVMKHGEYVKSYSRAFIASTNNRMELMAVLDALNKIKPGFYDTPIRVTSDSKYVIDAFNKGWLQNWVKKNFKKVANVDLWRDMYEVTQKFDNITWLWVPGHTGHQYNEACDSLALTAAMLPDEEREIDSGYGKA